MRKFLQAVASRRRSNRSGNASVTDYGNDPRTLRSILLGGKKTKSVKTSARRTASKKAQEQDDPSLAGHSTHSMKSGDSSINGDAASFSDDSSASPVEWKLPLVDEDNSEPQSMEQELQRLQALQSYFVLDSEGEDQFDSITGLASQIFDTPIALVSLVDLGRQWFLSRVGLDATETARKHAFCAHVILNKHKILVVPDATQDARFQDNPLVTGGIKIRFYAGAALVSPEGYKLGTLCVISDKVRPQGLSDSQQNMLHEMAGMVVNAMVARRNRMLKQDYQERLQKVTQAMVETTQHLDQTKTQVQQVLDRQSWDMDHEDTMQLTELMRSLEVRSKICSATTRNVLLDVVKAGPVAEEEKSTGAETPKTIRSSTTSMESSMNNNFLEETLMGFDEIVNPVTDMEKLFDNVNIIVAKFPYRHNVTVELHKSVPKRIVAEDLLLFRSVLNLLTHCMGQHGGDLNGAESSSSLNQSGLIIRRSASRDDELLVKAVQRGNPVSKEAAHDLFKNKDSLLAPVASMVRSMGGRFGMFEGMWTHGGSASAPPSGAQSIFWFQIPYGLSETDTIEPSQNKLDRSLVQEHSAGTSPTLTKKMVDDAALQSDPFQNALLEVGCGGR